MVTFVGMKSKEEEKVQCSSTTMGALILIILFSKMIKKIQKHFPSKF
jgi:heme/copper-type cytochrome/quinol oxidase subunit 4